MISNAIQIADKPTRASKMMSIERIAEKVCAIYRLPVVKVYTNDRHKITTCARSAIVAIAREFTWMSYPQIAKHFNMRSHTTAMNAASRGKQLIGFWNVRANVAFDRQLKPDELSTIRLCRYATDGQGGDE